MDWFGSFLCPTQIVEDAIQAAASRVAADAWCCGVISVQHLYPGSDGQMAPWGSASFADSPQ
ncbi:hypothetical protein AR457_33655 [Streptomyces agglomeratus]|nr:hypothetical protein AR457_33655 [Streptomyces agglomeratus]